MSNVKGKTIIIATLLITILLGLLMSAGCIYQDTSSWTALDWELAKAGITRQEYEISVKRNKVVSKYVENVLYVGYSENDFISRFTRDSSWTDPERAYIIEHQGNQYIILTLPGPTDDKARVTFDNGKLIKYEKFDLGTNRGGYSNCTAMLRGSRGE